MFDIGWTEMLVIAVVMIVVVGPKDLPKMLRTFGRTTAKLRAMAGDFQKQFNEALKEAELDDVKKSVDSLRSLNPMAEVRKQLNPFEKAASDVRSGLDAAMKPAPKPEPATPETHAAEPLKNGATAIPGVSGPEAMPSTPAFPAMADPAPAAKATPVKAPEPVKTVVRSAPTARNGAKKPASASAAKAKVAAPRTAASDPAVRKAGTKPASAKKKPAGSAT